MGIITSPLFTEARGSLGNIIIYKVGDQIRIRTKPLTHRDKKSVRQLAQRLKLKKCLSLYGLLDSIFLYSWRTKAKNTAMNGCNLFIKENIRNFTDEGEIADWANLKICAGSYPFPENWRVEQASPGMLTLCWNPEDQSVLAFDDILQIGAYGFADDDEEVETLFRVKNVRAVRREGECCFRIPASRSTLHFYACFKNLYTNEYTDSIYLGEMRRDGSFVAQQ